MFFFQKFLFLQGHLISSQLFVFALRGFCFCLPWSNDQGVRAYKRDLLSIAALLALGPKVLCERLL